MRQGSVKRWSPLLSAFIMAVGLSACDKAKEVSDAPVPTASETIIIPESSSPPPSPSPKMENAKTTLFAEIGSTEPPTIMNLTIEGREYSSPFILMDLQRFGFFVPGAFKLFAFEDGSRIGVNDAEWINLDRENRVTGEPIQDTELAKYKEYAGSEVDENGVRHDVFYIQTGDATDTFVTFRYFEQNRDKVLPAFMEVARHMRYLKRNAAEDKAEEDVQKFLYLVKKKDKKALLALLKTSDFYSYLTLEDAAKALEGFDHNFNLRSLRATLHFSGLSMNPAVGQFEYVFHDRKHAYPQMDDSRLEETLILALRYDDQGKPLFHTPYVRYFPFAQKMAEQYMSLIKQGKVKELAALLNPDDAEVPDSVAKKVIERYNDHFDLNLVTVQYDHGFSFKIVQKNKTSHTIRIIYGDGLMAISDDYNSKK